MQLQAFFSQLVDLYKQQQNSKKIAENIFRGRSRSISSAAEDLVAQFISKNIKRQCTYYIDQPLQFGASNIVKYPDIFILENDKTISHLIDIKLDVGWNRDAMLDFCDIRYHEVIKVLGETTQFNTKNDMGEKVENKNMRFSENLTYHILLLSKENSKKDILDQHYTQILNKYKNIKLYILSEGIHPNEYVTKEEIMAKLQVNDTDFHRLLSALNNEIA
ncbi:hypothetical protein C9426_03940 [Serratia sp. S1B]|nr:hypothetical protein C9426_03940 [Serratia sp. S1B]